MQNTFFIWLTADAQFLDQGPVALNINAFQIFEESLALTYQAEKGPATGVVVPVRFQVLGKALNAECKQGYLPFCRTGVAGRTGVRLKDLCFLFFC